MLATSTQAEEEQGLAGILLRHDLRQPLAAVTLLVDAITTVDGLPPDVRAGLDLIQQHTEWMRRLIRGHDDDGPVEVTDLADAVPPWSHEQPWAPYRVEIDHLDHAPVLVDPVALQRATRNLLANATRAVADGGVVEVSVRAEDGHGVLEVADSGPGFGHLAPEHGHGLVGVRRFVERFGGQLACGTSSLGGALVTLSLPLAVGW